jgi:hypothetical protein
VSLNKNIMMRSYRIIFFIIVLLWFLVNLIQATYTEILSDEAYYGLFGKYLDWGYFDHPPMIALLTKISSVFFNGNLGIRFMTVVLQPFTLLLIWRIIDDPQPDNNKVFSFFIIASSICLFSVFGFFTTPDVPLLFFTAFFLFSYKDYLACQTWKNVILLSLSMAGLTYSKYHAFLVIGFVILSNIRLLKSYKFWVAGIIALILFTPNLLWQSANHYPSFKFQLIERSEGFQWNNILEYLPNQLAVYNPFVLGAVIYIIVRNKPKDLFTRALYFLIIGFIGFFGVASLNDHVEPQWTISCSVAMIILLYNDSAQNPEMSRFIRKTMLPVVVIILIGRIMLVSDITPGRELGFRGKKAKSEFIESVADDRPVLFPGSFQKPSLYRFFTGKEGLAVNTLYSRKTEFDIWQFEKKYNNKPAFIYGFADGRSRLFEKEGIKFYGYFTDSLQTINRIGVEISQGIKNINTGDSLSLSVVFKNPYPYDIDFNHRQFPVTVCMAFLKGRELNLFPVTMNVRVGIIRSGESLKRTVTALAPHIPEGRYHFGICLQTSLGPAINDSFSTIKIMKR